MSDEHCDDQLHYCGGGASFSGGSAVDPLAQPSHAPIVLPLPALFPPFGAMLAYQATDSHSFSLGTDILEILRNAGWSIFLVFRWGYTGKVIHPSISKNQSCRIGDSGALHLLLGPGHILSCRL